MYSVSFRRRPITVRFVDISRPITTQLPVSYFHFHTRNPSVDLTRADWLFKDHTHRPVTDNLVNYPRGWITVNLRSPIIFYLYHLVGSVLHHYTPLSLSHRFRSIFDKFDSLYVMFYVWSRTHIPSAVCPGPLCGRGHLLCRSPIIHVPFVNHHVKHPWGLSVTPCMSVPPLVKYTLTTFIHPIQSSVVITIVTRHLSYLLFYTINWRFS